MVKIYQTVHLLTVSLTVKHFVPLDCWSESKMLWSKIQCWILMESIHFKTCTLAKAMMHKGVHVQIPFVRPCLSLFRISIRWQPDSGKPAWRRKLLLLHIPFICQKKLPGVIFYRFNAKNWQFTVYFAVITQKIGNLLCILS